MMSGSNLLYLLYAFMITLRVLARPQGTNLTDEMDFESIMLNLDPSTRTIPKYLKLVRPCAMKCVADFLHLIYSRLQSWLSQLAERTANQWVLQRD